MSTASTSPRVVAGRVDTGGMTPPAPARVDAQQTDLLDYAAEVARARYSDPETSHAAAASVKVRDSQRKILALLAQGPATHEELAARAYEQGITISPSGLRTRCHELVDAGLVRDSTHRKRLPSGRSAVVWELRREAVAS